MATIKKVKASQLAARNGPTICELHNDEPKIGEWCKRCRTILRRAENAERGGERGAEYCTRLAIRVERWKAQGRPENIKIGMMQTAVRGMRFIYPPDGIRPDGTNACELKEEDKWSNRPKGDT